MHTLASLRMYSRRLGIALLLTFVLAVPGGVLSQSVWAQSNTGSGQFCPAQFAAGLACNPGSPSSIASNFTYCSDGSVVSASQGCPAGTSAIVPASNYSYCPDGSMVSVDQSCPAAPAASTVAAPVFTTVALPAPAALSETIPLPGGQYALITNPWNTTVSVSGADTVLVFDSLTGSYDQTSTLAPGQSAWAYSFYGGTATLTAL